MTNKEKCELLKGTIEQLYSKEGRSKNYISKLLKIDRKILTQSIGEWNLPKPKPERHLTPSNQKWLNKNRLFILSRYEKDVPETEIAKELGVTRDKLRHMVDASEELTNAKKACANRRKESHIAHVSAITNSSRLDYGYEEIDGEIWAPIPGWDMYEISNMGRVRGYATRYKKHYLLRQCPNKNNGRLYVGLTCKEKRKNLQVARVVAFAFVPGWSETNCTVNHKDGNVQNNRAENLEWTSQAENNLHAYRTLKRNGTYGNQYSNRYTGKMFLYKDSYEFKTVKALAKFMGKSETQVRRYLEKEHPDLKIVTRN